MEKMRNPNGYWTYERCEEVAKLHDSKNYFMKNHYSTYQAIIRNDWHELMSHMINKIKPSKYWTYNKCKEVSLKYDSKKEFTSIYGGAYKAILKNKWYELLSHIKNDGNLYKRLIYVYEFADNHCYVGLTFNIKKRNSEHTKDINSQVYKHTIKSNLKPNLIIITDYLNIEDAILAEEEILNKYKNNGWHTLNVSKTGGIGYKSSIWDKERCKSEADKYLILKDFYTKSQRAYKHIKINGWFDELCSHMRKDRDRKKYTMELCIIELNKYTKISHFKKNNATAYEYLRVNDLLKDSYKYLKK